VRTNEAAGMHFPFRATLKESIRNLFFHVPMWFGMVLLLLFGFVSSIMFLTKGDMMWDRMAHSSVVAGIVFGFLGLFTGMLWANFTWGHPWPGDAKLNGAAIGVLTYLAYLVLRGSLDDPEKRARIASVYNIFAFIIYIIFIFVLPRLTASLHPGNGGNPAFSQYDLDNTLRIFFYPAVIGWTIIGFWIMSIHLRLGLVKDKLRDSF
jgi:heme exporter protein C